MIEKGGKKGLGISVLIAYDDDLTMKNMSSGLFKNVINKTYLEIIYMYKRWPRG